MLNNEKTLACSLLTLKQEQIKKRLAQKAYVKYQSQCISVWKKAKNSLMLYLHTAPVRAIYGSMRYFCADLWLNAGSRSCRSMTLRFLVQLRIPAFKSPHLLLAIWILDKLYGLLQLWFSLLLYHLLTWSSHCKISRRVMRQSGLI